METKEENKISTYTSYIYLFLFTSYLNNTRSYHHTGHTFQDPMTSDKPIQDEDK